MLTFVVTMGIILLLAADLTYFTKKRQEIVLPLGFCMICVWEYIFALLGLLPYSVLLFIVLIVGLNVLLICRVRPSVSDIIKFFTPGIIIYILCGIVFTFFYWNKITVGGDEYSAWAITVKHMFYYDQLPCQGESNVCYNNYIPGVPLVKYFFLKLIGAYKENALYFNHAMWMVSLLIPIFAKVDVSTKRQKVVEYIFKLAICIFLPSTFCTDSYSFLVVDCLLGLMFAYGIFMILTQEKDGHFYFCECLVMMMLVLTKELGIVLAATLALMIILDGFTEVKWKTWKNMFMFLPVGIPYLSWKIFLKLYAENMTATANSMKVSVEAFVQLLTGGGTEEQYAIVRTFLKAFFNLKDVKLYGSEIPIPGIGYLIISVVCLFALKKLLGKRCYRLILGLCGGMLAYYGVLFYWYCYLKADDPNVYILSSYRRYTTSFWMGVLLAIMMTYLYSHYERRWVYSIVLGWMGISTLSIGMTGGRGYWRNAGRIALTESYIGNLQHQKENINKGDKVYVVSQDDGAGFLWAIYALTPVQCNLEKDGETGLPTYSLGYNSENVTGASNYSIEEWSDILQEYDYVYVCKTNERFEDTYGALFEDDITDDTLYKIIIHGNDLSLDMEGNY